MDIRADPTDPHGRMDPKSMRVWRCEICMIQLLMMESEGMRKKWMTGRRMVMSNMPANRISPAMGTSAIQHVAQSKLIR